MRPEYTDTPYARLGGEQGVRALARRFYELIDELPEAHAVRALHGADRGASEQKLFEFLSGWLGGPRLYVERHGPPNLRRRHRPFAIGHVERDQWLMCMRLALDEIVPDRDLRLTIHEALVKLAEHVRNRGDARCSGRRPQAVERCG